MRISLALVLLLACTPERDAQWTVELVVPGSDFHGVHGITTDAADEIYVGSVIGQSIYRVDRETGAVELHVGPPEGIADDLEFGPDGTLVWTAIFRGEVLARSPEGEISVLAEGLRDVNSLAFAPDGRLFATEVFGGDALYEIDPTGTEPARTIMRDMGGLNGFDFGPDGKLYGPIWFKGQVARVDVDTGTLEVVADGFAVPAAANFDSAGNLYVVDTELGQVVRVDVATGEKTLIAEVRPGIDNLTLDSRDRLYLTNMTDNAVIEINTETGTSRTLVEGQLSIPGDIALYSDGDVETVHIADVFAYRTVDTQTGEVTTVSRMQAAGNPTSISVHGDHVLMASWASGSVQVFARDTGELLRDLEEFSVPGDVIELDDGSLLVTELGTGTLVRVHEGSRTPLVTGLGGPACLARSGSSVYVTEVVAGQVSKIELPSGERSVVVSGLKQPEGIDILPDGRLVVAEVGERRIVAIDPTSGEIEVLASELAMGIPPLAELSPVHVISGVAVSETGAVYFTSDLENALYRLRRE